MAIYSRGKSERSDLFFPGRDFAIRTISIETVISSVISSLISKAGKFKLCNQNYEKKTFKYSHSSQRNYLKDWYFTELTIRTWKTNFPEANFIILGRVARKPCNVNQGLNVNWSTTFSCLKMFLPLTFGVVWDSFSSKLKGKQYKHGTFHQKVTKLKSQFSLTLG